MSARLILFWRSDQKVAFVRCKLFCSHVVFLNSRVAPTGFVFSFLLEKLHFKFEEGLISFLISFCVVWANGFWNSVGEGKEADVRLSSCENLEK